MRSEGEFKTKEIPLTQSFWVRLAHEKNFNINQWLKEQFPDLIIHQVAQLNSAIYPDGAIYIKYNEKTEDELYRERFLFMLDNIKVFEGATKKQKETKFGCCPECDRYILNWKPMFGGLAPEWWATMRERGIDPATGHSQSCSNKKLKYS